MKIFSNPIAINTQYSTIQFRPENRFSPMRIHPTHMHFDRITTHHLFGEQKNPKKKQIFSEEKNCGVHIQQPTNNQKEEN